MIKTKENIKKEKKELELFNKHKNLLLIAQYLDCHYCIYQQHLIEIALKLKYKVYNNHLKQTLYYTVNSLYKGLQELEKAGFIKRETGKLLSGGETSGYMIRLMSKAIKLLDRTDYCFKSKSTNLFWHTVLLKGKLLISVSDKYIKIAEKENIDTQEILKYISTNYFYNSFLGDSSKYYNSLMSLNTLKIAGDRDLLGNATNLQINNIKINNPKNYKSMEYLKIKEENKKLQDNLKTQTFYKMAKDRYIYFLCKIDNVFNFAILNPSENKTEKDFVNDYINVYNFFDKYLCGTNENNILKITFIVQNEYYKKNLTNILIDKKNEGLNEYIKNKLNLSFHSKIFFNFIIHNVIEIYGQSNIKKEKKQISLSEKYPTKNFDKKIRQIVIKDSNNNDDDI